MSAFGLAIGLAGCDPALPTSDEVPESGVVAAGHLRASLDGIPRPSSGYLVVAGSPIVPWCGAVLVAPDVVVTSAHCLHDVVLEDLGFQIGSTDQADEAVFAVAAIVHPQAGTAAHDLAALRLAESIDAIPPAEIGERSWGDCEVVSVSYLFALRDAVGRRWTWSGCADDAGGEPTIAITTGTPNCHGDTGAGIFDATTGALVGIATGARYADEHETCASAITFAPMPDNTAFLESALALSEP